MLFLVKNKTKGRPPRGRSDGVLEHFFVACDFVKLIQQGDQGMNSQLVVDFCMTTISRCKIDGMCDK
jgi:hypothetical protein